MIYFDNSATTALCQNAVNRMREAIEHYGNPSSLHGVGVDAHELLNKARECVMSSLGLNKSSGYRVIFTGSGSEANNTSVIGSVNAKTRFTTKRIITTNSEHPSIDEPLKYLASQGFEIVRLSTKNGVIDLDELREELEKGCFLITVMRVNNETGAVYDVERIFSEAKRICPGVITHCDATQGYLKTYVQPMKMRADMLTISAHKIHGPKGVGALVVSPEMIKTKKLVPYIMGGGQEDGLRSGTENMIGICGMYGAVEENFPLMKENIAKMTQLRDYITDRLSQNSEIILNIPQGERAPHIINITLPDIKSETMVHFLSAAGIAVSGGSACSSHSEHASASLTGFGLDRIKALSSIRISLCAENTKEEADMLVSALNDGIGRLVRVKR